MSKNFAIFGPPGCGKTHQIVERIKWYVDKGLRPQRIGLVSFTRKGAEELALRAGSRVGIASTIHSVCFRLAGLSRDQVLNKTQYPLLQRLTGIEINGANIEQSDEISIGDQYIALHQLAGTQLSDSQPTPEERHAQYVKTYENSVRVGEMDTFLWFCDAIDRFKEEYGIYDFNDMLRLALVLPSPDIDVLFVDEAQDLSPLQWAVVHHWTAKIPNVHIAGDDDQSIYVWGGADPRGMVKFEKAWGAKRMILEQSHRIPHKVHRVAEALIKMTSHRVDKTYLPRDEEGEVNLVSSPDFLEFNHGDDIMVLYRNHFCRKEIEAVLISRRIPYRTMSGQLSMLDSRTSKAVRNYEVIRKGGTPKGPERKIERSMKGIIDPLILMDMANGIAPTVPWHEAATGAESDTIAYLYDIEQQYGTLEPEPTVVLNTIHSSKGGEADRVVLINGMSQRCLDGTLIDLDSELRTFYVGITRAKRRLDVISGDNPFEYLDCALREAM